jgi:hypothetical protein
MTDSRVRYAAASVLSDEVFEVMTRAPDQDGRAVILRDHHTGTDFAMTPDQARALALALERGADQLTGESPPKVRKPNPAQAAALRRVADHGPVALGDVSRVIGRNTLARVLLRHGWLAWPDHPPGRAGGYVTLTRAGQAAIEVAP